MSVTRGTVRCDIILSFIFLSLPYISTSHSFLRLQMVREIVLFRLSCIYKLYQFNWDIRNIRTIILYTVNIYITLKQILLMRLMCGRYAEKKSVWRLSAIYDLKTEHRRESYSSRHVSRVFHILARTCMHACTCIHTHRSLCQSVIKRYIDQHLEND